MVGLAEQQPCMQEESSYQNDQDVGALFRCARQEKNITILQAARLTRIRQLYLESIESGHFDRLPGKIYTIGFIKTYAQILELDALEILRRLNLDKVDGAGVNKLVLAIPPQSQERPSFKIVFLTSFLAITLCGAAVVWSLAEKNIVQLWDQVWQQNGRSADEKYVASAQSQEEETTDSVSSDDTHSASHDELLPPELPVSQSSLKEGERAYDLDVKSPENTDLSVSSPPSPDSQPLVDKITILAVKDSWVQVLDAQGKSIFVRLMHAGEKFDLPEANGPYQLNTGNAGGIRIKLNEGLTGLLGTEGKVMRGIPITPEHIRQLGIIEEEEGEKDEGSLKTSSSSN